MSNSINVVAIVEGKTEQIFIEPEAINNSAQTAPSKRLDAWSKNGSFAKTTLGIAIASKIGIVQMRKKCPLFNAWIAEFENIVQSQT
jgi:hypothetical protein